MGDASAEDSLLDLHAGGGDATHSIVPKRGKKRLSNRFRNKSTRAQDAAPAAIPYVRHGRITSKTRSDREKPARTLRDIYIQPHP